MHMPTFHDVMTAHKAIRSYVHETPVLTSNALRQASEHEEIALKCENLQRTGSYNLRGAINHVIRSKQMELGINHFVARSGGNHGIAVALAASEFAATGHIVVPPNPKDIVVKAIRHYGGCIYPSGPTQEEQMRLVQQIMDSSSRGGGVIVPSTTTNTTTNTNNNNNNTNNNHMNNNNNNNSGDRGSCVFVHPQDGWLVAGDGTAGVELMLQTDCRLDAVVVPAAGGTLLAGVGLAVKGMKPNIAVFAAVNTDRVEKYKSNSNSNSSNNSNSNNNNNNKRDKNKNKKKNGKGVSDRVSGGGTTLPLELLGKMTAEVSECVERYVDGVVCVDGAATRHAFRFVYERCKLVIDADAATAVAAVLQRPEELRRYRHVGVILAGGNVVLDDIPKLARL